MPAKIASLMKFCDALNNFFLTLKMAGLGTTTTLESTFSGTHIKAFFIMLPQELLDIPSTKAFYLICLDHSHGNFFVKMNIPH
jgi:hypothetical protein